MDKGRVGEVFNFGVLHMEWPTAVFILVVFVITMILLNTLLFKPILNTLDARAKDSEKGAGRLTKIELDLADLEKGYQVKLNKYRDEMQSHREEVIGGARKEFEAIVGKSEKESAEIMSRAEESLASEFKQAMDEAMPIATTLSEEISAKVLKS